MRNIVGQVVFGWVAKNSGFGPFTNPKGAMIYCLRLPPRRRTCNRRDSALFRPVLFPIMDLAQFLLLLKQYGPLVGALIFLLWWFTRRIDGLLDRNATIYEGHIQHLWETQQRLLMTVLGAQESSLRLLLWKT